eukprot:1919784-Prymnesium_polylepis.1
MSACLEARYSVPRGELVHSGYDVKRPPLCPRTGLVIDDKRRPITGVRGSRGARRARPTRNCPGRKRVPPGSVAGKRVVASQDPNGTASAGTPTMFGAPASAHA